MRPKPASELAAFTRRLLALRTSHAVFRRTRFLDGGPAESALPDAWWFRPDGRPMAQRDWHELRHLGVFLNGQETDLVTHEGEPIVDDSFIVFVNAEPEPLVFRLPPRRFGLEWMLELTTAHPERRRRDLPGEVVRDPPRSLAHRAPQKPWTSRPRRRSTSRATGCRRSGGRSTRQIR